MEIFLITVVLIFLIACCCLNIFHFFRLTQRQKIITDTLSRVCDVLTENTEGLAHSRSKIDAMAHGLDRHLLALKELQEPTKPIKTNNWDSMREAFKGPTRVEINERN